MIPKPARSLLILLAVAFLGGSVAQAKTTLRWKFKEGDVFHSQSKQVNTSKLVDSGKELAQTLTLTIDMTWTVKSVDASGTASLAQKIDRIRTMATFPGGSGSDDSNEPIKPNSPVGPLFKMLVGAEFATKLSARGELTDIKLSEKLLATLRSGKEPAGADGQFSEVGLKNLLMEMVYVLPEEPVDVGAKWRKKVTVPAGPDGQTRDISLDYTYAGPDGKFEAIDLAITFEQPKPDPNVPITIKLQERKGRYLFDNAAGRIESMMVTERAEMTGKIEGKDVTQTVETVSTLAYSKDTPK